MKYFIFDHQRSGSCYHEFYKGKWDGKTFWKSDSIFLADDYLFAGFADAIKESVPDYDPFGKTEISLEQWNKIGETTTFKDAESFAVYREADAWLRNQVFQSHKCFTILGV